MFKDVGFLDLLRTLWITEKYAFRSNKEYLALARNILCQLESLYLTDHRPYKIRPIKAETLGLCPTKAMTLSNGDKGPPRVEIDLSKCIECSLCKKIFESQEELGAVYGACQSELLSLKLVTISNG